jgi:hypothetical protein
MGLSCSHRKQRSFERLFLLVAFVNRFMPVFLRQGGSPFYWPTYKAASVAEAG